MCGGGGQDILEVSICLIIHIMIIGINHISEINSHLLNKNKKGRRREAERERQRRGRQRRGRQGGTS